MLAHFGAAVVAMDYSASGRRAAADFVGCVVVDVVPMKMAAIGLACVKTHDDVSAMDYLI